VNHSKVCAFALPAGCGAFQGIERFRVAAAPAADGHTDHAHAAPATPATPAAPAQPSWRAAPSDNVRRNVLAANLAWSGGDRETTTALYTAAAEQDKADQEAQAAAPFVTLDVTNGAAAPNIGPPAAPGGYVYRIDGKEVTKAEYDAADAQNKATPPSAQRGGHHA